MLARIRANQIGNAGIRLAAVLAASQITALAAKVGDNARLPEGCGSGSAINVAAMMGQTAWSMLDACVVGRLVHVAGMLIAPDSSFSAIHTVTSIIGHEVVARVMSFAIQILS